MSLTTNPNDPCLKDGQKNEGQNDCYLVLSEEERNKGFIRPYRDSYVHVGKKVNPKDGIIESLTDEEKERYKNEDYVAFLKFPENPNSSIIGKFLSRKELENTKKGFTGCGVVTTMGQALSETYCVNPKFYSATFCVGCNKHLPVSEFLWKDTDEQVGS